VLPSRSRGVPIKSRGERFDVTIVELTAPSIAAAAAATAAPPAVLTSSPPPLPPAHQVSLAPHQVAQLMDAQRSAAKVRWAAAVARFDAWTIATFGALTLLFGLTSAASVLLGLAMLAAALVEFRGADRLRRLEPSAAKTLGINQLCLAGALIAYASWQLYVTYTTPSSFATAAGSDAQLQQMMLPLDELARTLTSAVYVLLIVVAVCMQGGTALYYFTRKRHLDGHLRRTPNWVADLQRAGVAV
jgi:hypothetical protein